MFFILKNDTVGMMSINTDINVVKNILKDTPKS